MIAHIVALACALSAAWFYTVHRYAPDAEVWITPGFASFLFALCAGIVEWACWHG